MLGRRTASHRIILSSPRRCRRSLPPLLPRRDVGAAPHRDRLLHAHPRRVPGRYRPGAALQHGLLPLVRISVGRARYPVLFLCIFSSHRGVSSELISDAVLAARQLAFLFHPYHPSALRISHSSPDFACSTERPHFPCALVLTPRLVSVLQQRGVTSRRTSRVQCYQQYSCSVSSQSFYLSSTTVSQNASCVRNAQWELAADTEQQKAVRLPMNP